MDKKILACPGNAKLAEMGGVRRLRRLLLQSAFRTSPATQRRGGADYAIHG